MKFSELNLSDTFGLTPSERERFWKLRIRLAQGRATAADRNALRRFASIVRAARSQPYKP